MAAVQDCGERELQSTPPRIVLKPPHFKSHAALDFLHSRCR
jgi:hypothetical protein